MPADDLVLNVRQISGYPDGGILPSDTLLMQRGGLGGPYVSVEAETLVAGALQRGGPLQVGVDVPVNAGTGGILCDWLVGDALYLNAYTDLTTDFNLAAGPAAKLGLFGDVLTFSMVSSGAAGAPITWAPAATLNALGEMAVVGLTLGRDPIAPLEAATAQWVLANTVSSFNMRRGAIMLNVDDIICAGGAPIFSPMLQGCPQAPTVPPWTNSSQIATTAFVHMAIAEYLVGGGGYAPLDSPAFSGVPTAPTAPLGSADGQLATTAFVMTAVADSTAGVASFNGRTGLVTLTSADINGVGGALLSSPIFVGAPQAPTATPGTSTAQLATTAFVQAALAGSSGVASFNGRTGLVTLTSADIAAVGVSTFNGRIGAVNLIANDISAAGGAILASPAFTGVPTAPTATAGTNTGQLATTAYVQAAVSAGGGVLSFNGRAGTVTLSLADVTAVLPASTTAPLVSGTAAAGSANAWSRGDHIHPTDTSRAAVAQLANYLPLGGGTLTGALNGVAATMTGVITASTVVANGAGSGCVSRASGASNAAFILQNNASATVGTFFWQTTGVVGIQQSSTSAQAYLNASGTFLTTGGIQAGSGYTTKSGTTGGVGGNNFNFQWAGGNFTAYIDTASIGNVSFTSDYRIKKDVAALPSMWERAKTLRPIRYSLRDFWPGTREGAPFIAADDIERWGFIAHELQETLIEDAATGVKDANNLIQSPNPWTVIACLAKALQEAMTRIEALEVRI